jgi:hypothetical protein
VEIFSPSTLSSDGRSRMRSERAERRRSTKGSNVWTVVGWLVFAVPFCLYMILQLALGAGIGVPFGT